MVTNYREMAKAEIQRWEARGPSFYALLEHALFPHLFNLSQAMIPDELQDEIALTVEQTIAFDGIDFLSPGTARRLKDERKELIQVHGDELAASDRLAKRCWRSGIAQATLAGAYTGLSGWSGLAQHIPGLYVVTLRTLQEMAYCYGFDLESHAEQDYLLHLISLGACGKLEWKLKFVDTVKKLEVAFLMEAEQAVGRPYDDGAKQSAFQETAFGFGMGLARRKAIQLLPIVGALMGAATNALYIHDVAEAAFMSYRRRRLLALEGVTSNAH